MKSNSPFLRLWGFPIILAIATLIGLVSALIGDGILDGLSWLLLGTLLLVIVYYTSRIR